MASTVLSGLLSSARFWKVPPHVLVHDVFCESFCRVIVIIIVLTITTKTPGIVRLIHTHILFTFFIVAWSVSLACFV